MCVRVYVREREGEREGVCVCVGEREVKDGCMWVDGGKKWMEDRGFKHFKSTELSCIPQVLLPLRHGGMRCCSSGCSGSMWVDVGKKWTDDRRFEQLIQLSCCFLTWSRSPTRTRLRLDGRGEGLKLDTGLRERLLVLQQTGFVAAN